MTQVYYYLKRAQATAKEEEFCVPSDLRAKKDIEIEKLFPLTIVMLGDISGKINRSEEINIEKMRKQLEVSAKFFASYYATRGMESYDDYLLLLAAVCYYFLGQVGSAYILVAKISADRLIEFGGLATALYHMLSGKKSQISTEDFCYEEITLYLEDFFKALVTKDNPKAEYESRGVQFELLVSRILANIATDSQKILISAIVDGVESLNKWISKGDGGIVTDENFVPAEKNIIALNSSIFQKRLFYQLEYMNKNNLTNVDYYVPRIFEQVKIDDSIVFPGDCNDQSIAVMMRLIQRDNCAIFCGTKKNVDSIINRIIELEHKGVWHEGLFERNNQEEQNKIANLYQVTYGNINLYEAANKGIFAHHSAISDGIKASVEFALQKALITNVICTSTLAQGVNMPIKYMIFTSLFQGGKPIGVKDFQNLVGRVGRPGMYLEGNIIFADVNSYKKRTWQWDNFKRMFLVDDYPPHTRDFSL